MAVRFRFERSKRVLGISVFAFVLVALGAGSLYAMTGQAPLPPGMRSDGTVDESAMPKYLPVTVGDGGVYTCADGLPLIVRYRPDHEWDDAHAELERAWLESQVASGTIQEIQQADGGVTTIWSEAADESRLELECEFAQAIPREDRRKYGSKFYDPGTDDWD